MIVYRPPYILIVSSIVAKTGIASVTKGTTSLCKTVALATLVAGQSATNVPYVRLYTEVSAGKAAMATSLSASRLAIAIFLGTMATCTRPIGLYPASTTTATATSLTRQGLTALTSICVVATTLLSPILTRQISVVRLQAISAIEAVYTTGPVAKVAKDVVVDGPRRPISIVAIEAVVASRLLVASAMMAMSLLATTGQSVSDRAAGAAKGLVVGQEMATTISTSIS